MYSYTLKYFYLRTFDDSFVEGFKIMDESDLAWLADTFFICEASGTKQSCAIDYVVEES